MSDDHDIVMTQVVPAMRGALKNHFIQFNIHKNYVETQKSGKLNRTNQIKMQDNCTKMKRNYKFILDMCQEEDYAKIVQGTRSLSSTDKEWRECFLEEFKKTNPKEDEKTRVKKVLLLNGNPPALKEASRKASSGSR